MSGKKLTEFSGDVTKGINYIKYNLCIDENAMKTLERYVNEDRKEPIKIKKADNGFAYLRGGKYVVEVSKGGVKAEGELVVKER